MSEPLTTFEIAEIQSIGLRLRTQDNRITQDPMFCVQEKVKVFGINPLWSDAEVWIDTSDGAVECEAPKDGIATTNIIQTGVFEYWKTVMVAFTEGGCEEYLRQNGHNHHGETRIYVESFRRCPEMIAIRKLLMDGGQELPLEKELAKAIKERDEHAQSAGQRWKELDAERQDHAITKRDLAESEARCEAMRDALKLPSSEPMGRSVSIFSKLKCPHEHFSANVDVNRLSDSGRFCADVRIKCEDCGELFRFLGLPAGLDLNGASVSVDGTEAHLAIGTVVSLGLMEQYWTKSGNPCSRMWMWGLGRSRPGINAWQGRKRHHY